MRRVPFWSERARVPRDERTEWEEPKESDDTKDRMCDDVLLEWK